MFDRFLKTWEEHLASATAEKGLREMAARLIQDGDFRFLDSPPGEIYPFATPLIVPREPFEAMVDWTRAIVRAIQELGRRCRTHPSEARATLILPTRADEAFFLLEPGFPDPAPIFRLDMVMPLHGKPQLLEINTGCPGGELDPALTAEAFSTSGPAAILKELLSEKFNSFLLKYQDPRDESLNILLKNYNAFRQQHPHVPEKPTIALVTSQAQEHFMIPEARGIARHYQRRGYRALIGDLLNLEPDGDGLRLDGEPVHLIFRKFSTLSFRLRLERKDRFGSATCARVRQIWEAVAGGRVCLINPLGSTALQDKGLLAELRRSRPELKDVIPPTYILEPGLPADRPDLWEAIREGEAFILKRRISFAGRHVVLDPADVRARAPVILRGEPNLWVAQERVDMPVYPFAVHTEHGVRTGRFPFNVNPFGRSAFVRLGVAGPYEPRNAHQGGAATAMFVVGR
jgi:hypothetical protein